MLKSSTGSLQEQGVSKNPCNNLGDQNIQNNQHSVMTSEGLTKPFNLKNLKHGQISSVIFVYACIEPSHNLQWNSTGTFVREHLLDDTSLT